MRTLGQLGGSLAGKLCSDSRLSRAEAEADRERDQVDRLFRVATDKGA